MKNFHFLLITFAEWLEANVFIVLMAGFTWLTSLGGLIWYLRGELSSIKATGQANGEKVEALGKQFADHADDLDAHVRDGNMHTTFEYRQSVQAQFLEIKKDMHEGHNRIENKLDRLVDRLIK